MNAAMKQITGAGGELLPSKTVPFNVRSPVLNVVSEDINSALDDLSTESSYDSDEDSDGFYVEMSLSCVNKEGVYDERRAIFNFRSSSNYINHADTGFDDIESYFEDSINRNFPGWSYADEWEEFHVYDNEFPEDHDGIIIDVV